jgi:2-keto-4-pentenoate hydratase/2-oxohepta-3-ene-1,7-dioic acid hydratase in catechol pathway
VNGAKKQSARVSDMVFGVETIFRWIAEAMTLEPGDVIATGTPAGVGPLSAGDVVEVRVGAIGTLRNSVVGPRD